MSWENYKRETSSSDCLGDRRVVIIGAEEAKSEAGKSMIVITLKPSGTKMTIKDYLVAGDWFNRKATQIFDSFNIEEGNFNLVEWTGAEGAAHFVLNENGYNKIRWYISKNKAESLPAFEGTIPTKQEVAKFEESAVDDDLPF